VGDDVVQLSGDPGPFVDDGCMAAVVALTSASMARRVAAMVRAS